MKPAAKYLLITLGVLALLAPALYVIAVSAALKHHAKEDRIVLGSKRVQEAINEYIEKHGNPPPKLDALVPGFIEATPTFPDILKVDYRLSVDGREWTLDLLRADRKVPLIYRRTNAGLSSEDAARRIDTANGCYILKVR